MADPEPGDHYSIFIVESFWPDVDLNKLDNVDRVLRAAASTSDPAGAFEYDASASGAFVYGGSVLLKNDEIIISVFAARSPEPIRRACMRAGLPFEGVVEGVVVGDWFGVPHPMFQQ